MWNSDTKIIGVVSRETRLKGLKARWTTKNQANFILTDASAQEVERRRSLMRSKGKKVTAKHEQQWLEAADELAEMDTYEEEADVYDSALKIIMRELDIGLPVKLIERKYVSNFDFGRCLAVIVVGQDGLVANVAKYAGDLPIVGINPDPARYDGILLPFEVSDARKIIQRVIKQKARFDPITMAQAQTNDGQKMLAFNDFFVGAKTHVSARYTLECERGIEQQSSSGIIVSTGAGSTGWLSSVFNMANGINRFHGESHTPGVEVPRSERRLMWVVREPFVSRHSTANFVLGTLEDQQELIVGSQMPSDGVIFSDGIEEDFLEFHSGCIAHFSVAQQQANLVVG